MRLAAILGAVLVAACAPARHEVRGGGAQGERAESAGQTEGARARSAATQARPESASEDGVSCDAKSNGLAWCEGAGRIVFCNHGEFYYLDCASFGEGYYCGFDDENHVVDCVSDRD